jgi:hypothetical protein
MTHVSLDSQPEAVKQFLRSLPVDPDGSVLEIAGEAVAWVAPPPLAANGASRGEEWTAAKNERRCTLIDREIDGIITPAELLELKQLQAEMLRYQDKLAPWPIEAARKLHKELLEKAAQASSNQ